MRIVIVEDDPMNGIVMSKILARMGGHHVVVTESVEEVRNLVNSHRADVIIMDVSLSNTLYEGEPIDGIQFTQLLRRASQIPILLATAHAMKGDADRFVKESGADGYIAKPISDPQDLLKSVTGCFEAYQSTNVSATERNNKGNLVF